MDQNTPKITEYMFLKSEPHKADVAIIFGTRHKEPIDAFMNLYNKELVKKVLVTGGINRITGIHEAIEIYQELIKRGVHKEDILLESNSTNSLENVKYSKQVIDEKIGLDKVSHIIYITKHYHARRALLTLKKYFPEHIIFHPVTYPLFDFDKSNWSQTEMGEKKILGEYEKIKKYQAKGDIAQD